MEVPLGMLELIEVEALDEETGQMSPEFAEILRMTPEETHAVRRTLATHMKTFARIELAAAERAMETGGAVIRLKPCNTEAADLNHTLHTSLLGILGPGRAAAARQMICKQLRHGGEDRMEISMGASLNGNGWTFDTVTFDPAGRKIATTSRQGLPRDDYSQFARWRHLDRLPKPGE